MSSLTDQEFKVITVENKKFLQLSMQNIPTNMLVMFYQDKCPACVAVKPVMEQVAAVLIREACDMGMVNVDMYPKIVKMSEGTTTLIDRVPLIFFYKNGIPTKVFSGNMAVDNIFRFIEYSAEDKSDDKLTLQLANAGITCNNDDCCYLTFDEL